MATRKRRHRVGGGKRKRSKKVKLIDLIRSLKAHAVFNRLRGRIQDASYYESQLDRAVHEAEHKGFSEQASNAEEAGRRLGTRLNRKKS